MLDRPPLHVNLGVHTKACVTSGRIYLVPETILPPVPSTGSEYQVPGTRYVYKVPATGINVVRGSCTYVRKETSLRSWHCEYLLILLLYGTNLGA